MESTLDQMESENNERNERWKWNKAVRSMTQVFPVRSHMRWENRGNNTSAAHEAVMPAIYITKRNKITARSNLGCAV